MRAGGIGLQPVENIDRGPPIVHFGLWIMCKMVLLCVWLVYWANNQI